MAGRPSRCRALATALRDALWLGLLASPLVAFDLVPGYERQPRLHWQLDDLGIIVAGVFLARLAVLVAGCHHLGLRLSQLTSHGRQRLARAWQQGRRWPALTLTVLFGLAAAFPFAPFVSRTAIDVATLAGIYVVLGLGLNIVVGLAGLLDLGYVAFYAVGAYGYGLLYQYCDWSFWMALPVCGLAAGLAGLVLGFPVLRLKGDYLAIVTLGFGEIIRIVLNNWDSLTNGPNGIMGIPRPSLFGLEMSRVARDGGHTFHQFFGLDYDAGHRLIFLYLLVLGLMAGTMLVVERLKESRLGRAWVAMREDEIACAAMGIDTTLTKLAAFGLGAAWAGLAGAVYAARQGFVNPESFTFIESATILAIVVLGGMGSTAGVTCAALAVVIIPELVRELAGFRMLIFAAVMVGLMIVKPEGLLPARRRIYDLHPDDRRSLEQDRQSLAEVHRQ
ncbi:MAG: high-affinity branched-chain amino acid ABC transporter permease LivM [Thermodesulfobacteriota bacterium]